MNESEAQTAEQGPGGAAPRILRRSRRSRVLAGVCGGLGDYLGIDPVLLRVAFVILAIASFGWGILGYGILVLAIPKERSGEHPARPASRPDRDNAHRLVGLSLIALGAIFLFNLLIPIQFAIKFIGPLVLIAMGAFILFRR